MSNGKNMQPHFWFFMRLKPQGREYITSFASWTRRDLIAAVVRDFGQSWEKTYRAGGRVIKCSVKPIKKGAAQ